MEWLESPDQRELRSLKQAVLEEGRDLLDLSMINPDIIPPRLLVDRLLEATLKLSNHRYAVSRGVRRAREGFASLYEQKFSTAIDPETQVCLTFGTKDAMTLIAMKLRERGKALLLPSPTYQAFLYSAFYAGLPYEFYAVSENEDEMLRSIAARILTGRFGAVVLNFPNNPTGITVSSRFYQQLGSLLRDSETIVVNDFVYGEMQGERQSPVSMLSEPELAKRGVETYSLSKSYSVPGWRVGALLGEPALVRSVSQLKSLVDYGLFLPFQIAAAAALTSTEDVASSVTRQYASRLRVVRDLLVRRGWEVPSDPIGAFIWARLPKESRSLGAVAYAKKALARGVAMTPGSIFGADFHEYVRFALVAREDRLRTLEELLP